MIQRVVECIKIIKGINRAAYEYKDNKLSVATDVWGVSIQYEYKKDDLVGIQWPSGRTVNIL